MKPGLGGLYTLDDDTNDGQLREWLAAHSGPDTQAPVVSFFLELCKSPRPETGRASEIVWTPIEDGFQAVGVTWVVDRNNRMIRVVDVSDREGELR